MAHRRTKTVLFALLLAIFSANYFFWAILLTFGISNHDLFGKFPRLLPLAVVSQRLRVFDSPLHFPTQNEIRVNYLDGRSEVQNLNYSSFRNPLDSLFFFHAWYWDAVKETGSNQKDSLLRYHFCYPGAKSVEWKIRYQNTVALDLGRTSC